MLRDDLAKRLKTQSELKARENVHGVCGKRREKSNPPVERAERKQLCCDWSTVLYEFLSHENRCYSMVYLLSWRPWPLA